LEALKQKVKEIEDEEAKIQSVSTYEGLNTSSGNFFHQNLKFSDSTANKEDLDSRSVFVGNVSP
jgi:hypothetical protein